MFDYHTAFHDILGDLTTIRSAGSVISEEYQDQIPVEANQLLNAINQRSEQLVNKIMVLKEEIYKVTEERKN